MNVSYPRQSALKGAKQKVPPPVPIRALVDTGASGTALDPTIVQQLALVPTGQVQLLTPSTNGIAHSCNQYDVMLSIPHPSLVRHWTTLPVMECNLLTQGGGFHMLLGRDVLKGCMLVYDGQGGTFHLAF